MMVSSSQASSQTQLCTTVNIVSTSKSLALQRLPYLGLNGTLLCTKHVCTCIPLTRLYFHHSGAVQVERLYTGPQDAEIVEHIKACNPRGPLLVHIAKLYPKQDCSTFDAFGRVFSGTVKAGDKVRACTVSAHACFTSTRDALNRVDKSLAISVCCRTLIDKDLSTLLRASLVDVLCNKQAH